MSRLLNSNERGGLKRLKEIREETIKKWDELGLLEGIGKGNPKMNIAMLIEPDAVQFLDGYEPTWCVYILRCVDGTLYCGMTNNIIRRLDTHRKGNGAKYTRGRLPVILEAYRSVESKSEALKLEYKVKKQPRHKKIEFLRSSGGSPNL
jgi:putative endonuclease